MTRIPLFFVASMISSVCFAQSLPITPTESAAATVATPIAPNATEGTIKFLAFPSVILNKKEAQLAPGARIYNTNHTSVSPSSLYEQTWRVTYQIGTFDLVQNVWLQKQK